LSSLIPRFTVKYSIENYFVFSKFYCIFYGFFKFLLFSEYINENRKSEKKSLYGAGPVFQPKVWHYWPGPKANRARVARPTGATRPARGGAAPGGSQVDEVGRGRRCEHWCGPGDPPDKARWSEAHRSGIVRSSIVCKVHKSTKVAKV
jgi:hypothetical protein